METKKLKDLTTKKAAFTLAEVPEARQYRGNLLKAFTLAEVLISLAIIGVVAAMTIPTLIAHNNQRAWDTAANVFERKLGEALNIMNTQQNLGGLGSTENFVNELSKNIKIVGTCKNPTECFAKEIKAGSEQEVIDVTKITKSKNLYSTADPDWETNVMGVQFADGVTALVAYNPSCKSDPYSNEVVRVTGDVKNNGKEGSVGLSTKCISILYDVNGYSTPNYYTTGTTKSDLRGINVSLKTNFCSGTEIGGQCVANFEKDYSAVDCRSSNSSADDYQNYCGPTPSGFKDDYWAGAKKKCADEGLTLPDITTLATFYSDHYGEEGVPTTGWFWSSTEDFEADSPQTDARYMTFDDDGYEDYNYKGSQGRVLCIGN